MQIKQIQCHTVVIGAGTAGLEAFKYCQDKGIDCIIVEQGSLGTTAQRVGELPLSLLMDAGQSLRSLRELKKNGIEFSNDLEIDTSRVLSSLRQVRSRATSEVLSFMYRLPEAKRIHGRAKFLDANTLFVNENLKISFKTAIIATGSSPLITYEQSRLKNILTTNDFFELDKLPESIAIFGSSKLGLQLGQALSYLGVDSVVFGQKKLWRLTNDAVLTQALQMLSSRFNLYIDNYITAMEYDEKRGGYDLNYLDEAGFENFLHRDSVIAASIRIPNVGGMGLQNIGIKLNQAGYIVVDENTMQTSLPHIFAAGDVCHETHLSSLASSEGKIAGFNACHYPVLKQKQKQVPIDIVYTDPVLAVVGMSYEECLAYAAKTNDSFISCECNLPQGHFRGLREDGGIISLYTSIKTRQVIGAEICAFKGEKIAQFLALAMENKMDIDKLAQYNYYNLSVQSVIGRVANLSVKKLEKI